MKTDGAFELFSVDFISDETKRFFCEKSKISDMENVDVEYLGGKQSGIEASLFSASAFKYAASYAPEDLARDTALYLNQNPFVAMMGESKDKNGYINFYYSKSYMKSVIAYYAEKFDELVQSGESDKYLYGRESGVYGLRRYCISRILSVCSVFSEERNMAIAPAECFTDDTQVELAEQCVYSLGKQNISVNDARRNSEFIAKLFYTADSCIKNATMIYLDLYKACAYTLHALIMKEDKN